MNTRIFSRLMAGIWLFLLVVSVLICPVSADTGPKPSVRIRFLNMGDEVCYATLLSKAPSTGPHSVWDGDEEHIGNYGLDPDIWRAFATYEDSDGFYFLQVASEVQTSKEYAWTYYPPPVFKVLLYYPASGEFAVSGICERYAFDSYYTVDMADSDDAGGISAAHDTEGGGDRRLIAFRIERYMDGILPLGARMLLTIALEVAVALLFDIRGGKALLLLASVNVLTQALLNGLLIGSFALFPFAYGGFLLFYLALELLVFALEAFLYVKYLKRWDKRARRSRVYILYALVANAVSFLCGLVLSTFWPGMF